MLASISRASAATRRRLLRPLAAPCSARGLLVAPRPTAVAAAADVIVDVPVRLAHTTRAQPAPPAAAASETPAPLPPTGATQAGLEHPVVRHDRALFRRILDALFTREIADTELMQTLAITCHDAADYSEFMRRLKAARADTGFYVKAFEAQLIMLLCGRFGSLDDALLVFEAVREGSGDVLSAARTALLGMLVRQCRTPHDLLRVINAVVRVPDELAPIPARVLASAPASEVAQAAGAGATTAAGGDASAGSGGGGSGSGGWLGSMSKRGKRQRSGSASVSLTPAQQRALLLTFADEGLRLCVQHGMGDLGAAVVQELQLATKPLSGAGASSGGRPALLPADEAADELATLVAKHVAAPIVACLEEIAFRELQLQARAPHARVHVVEPPSASSASSATEPAGDAPEASDGAASSGFLGGLLRRIGGGSSGRRDAGAASSASDAGLRGRTSPPASSGSRSDAHPSTPPAASVASEPSAQHLHALYGGKLRSSTQLTSILRGSSPLATAGGARAHVLTIAAAAAVAAAEMTETVAVPWTLERGRRYRDSAVEWLRDTFPAAPTMHASPAGADSRGRRGSAGGSSHTPPAAYPHAVLARNRLLSACREAVTERTTQLQAEGRLHWRTQDAGAVGDTAASSSNGAPAAFGRLGRGGRSRKTNNAARVEVNRAAASRIRWNRGRLARLQAEHREMARRQQVIASIRARRQAAGGRIGRRARAADASEAEAANSARLVESTPTDEPPAGFAGLGRPQYDEAGSRARLRSAAALLSLTLPSIVKGAATHIQDAAAKFASPPSGGAKTGAVVAPGAAASVADGGIMSDLRAGRPLRQAAGSERRSAIKQLKQEWRLRTAMRLEAQRMAKSQRRHHRALVASLKALAATGGMTAADSVAALSSLQMQLTASAALALKLSALHSRLPPTPATRPKPQLHPRGASAPADATPPLRPAFHPVLGKHLVDVMPSTDGLVRDVVAFFDAFRDAVHARGAWVTEAEGAMLLHTASSVATVAPDVLHAVMKGVQSTLQGTHAAIVAPEIPEADDDGASAEAALEQLKAPSAGLFTSAFSSFFGLSRGAAPHPAARGMAASPGTGLAVTGVGGGRGASAPSPPAQPHDAIVERTVTRLACYRGDTTGVDAAALVRSSAALPTGAARPTPFPAMFTHDVVVRMPAAVAARMDEVKAAAAAFASGGVAGAGGAGDAGDGGDTDMYDRIALFDPVAMDEGLDFDLMLDARTRFRAFRGDGVHFGEVPEWPRDVTAGQRSGVAGATTAASISEDPLLQRVMRALPLASSLPRIATGKCEAAAAPPVLTVLDDYIGELRSLVLSALRIPAPTSTSNTVDITDEARFRQLRDHAFSCADDLRRSHPRQPLVGEAATFLLSFLVAPTRPPVSAFAHKRPPRGGSGGGKQGAATASSGSVRPTAVLSAAALAGLTLGPQVGLWADDLDDSASAYAVDGGYGPSSNDITFYAGFLEFARASRAASAAAATAEASGVDAEWGAPDGHHPLLEAADAALASAITNTNLSSSDNASFELLVSPGTPLGPLALEALLRRCLHHARRGLQSPRSTNGPGALAADAVGSRKAAGATASYAIRAPAAHRADAVGADEEDGGEVHLQVDAASPDAWMLRALVLHQRALAAPVSIRAVVPPEWHNALQAGSILFEPGQLLSLASVLAEQPSRLPWRAHRSMLQVFLDVHAPLAALYVYWQLRESGPNDWLLQPVASILEALCSAGLIVEAYALLRDAEHHLAFSLRDQPAAAASFVAASAAYYAALKHASDFLHLEARAGLVQSPERLKGTLRHMHSALVASGPTGAEELVPPVPAAGPAAAVGSGTTGFSAVPFEVPRDVTVDMTVQLSPAAATAGAGANVLAGQLRLVGTQAPAPCGDWMTQCMRQWFAAPREELAPPMVSAYQFLHSASAQAVHTVLRAATASEFGTEAGAIDVLSVEELAVAAIKLKEPLNKMAEGALADADAVLAGCMRAASLTWPPVATAMVQLSLACGGFDQAAAILTEHHNQRWKRLRKGASFSTLTALATGVARLAPASHVDTDTWVLSASNAEMKRATALLDAAAATATGGAAAADASRERMSALLATLKQMTQVVDALDSFESALTPPSSASPATASSGAVAAAGAPTSQSRVHQLAASLTQLQHASSLTVPQLSWAFRDVARTTLNAVCRAFPKSALPQALQDALISAAWRGRDHQLMGQVLRESRAPSRVYAVASVLSGEREEMRQHALPPPPRRDRQYSERFFPTGPPVGKLLLKTRVQTALAAVEAAGRQQVRGVCTLA